MANQTTKKTKQAQEPGSSSKAGSLLTKIKKVSDRGPLPGALLAEMLGTFVLTFAVLNTAGNAVVAAVTLLFLILILSALSDAHFNPIATIALFVTRQIDLKKTLGYLAAQFLGAVLAWMLAKWFIAGSTGINPSTGASTQAELFNITFDATRYWQAFFGEFLGAVIFGLGIASVKFGKKVGVEAAMTIGGALLLGLIVATVGSSAVLNPAVALGLGVFYSNDYGSLWAYALAPALGAIIGAGVYRLLLNDSSE